MIIYQTFAFLKKNINLSLWVSPVLSPKSQAMRGYVWGLQTPPFSSAVAFVGVGGTVHSKGTPIFKKNGVLSGCSQTKNIWGGYRFCNLHHLPWIWLAALFVLKELFRQDPFGNFIFLSLCLGYLLWASCCDRHVENRKSAVWLQPRWGYLHRRVGR